MLPRHTVVSVAETTTVGVGLTVIVILVVSLQPAVSVPINVNVVVEPRFAVVLLQLVQLNPPNGLHTYVTAPVAERFTLPPAHTVGDDAEGFTFGISSLIMVLSFEEQPDEVPVTVYVIVEPGDAVTLSQVTQFNPVDGLHV